MSAVSPVEGEPPTAAKRETKMAMYENVTYKKQTGALLLTPTRVVFKSDDKKIKWSWKSIKKIQVSKDKLMIKFVSSIYEGNSVTFRLDNLNELSNLRQDVKWRLKQSRLARKKKKAELEAPVARIESTEVQKEAKESKEEITETPASDDTNSFAEEGTYAAEEHDEDFLTLHLDTTTTVALEEDIFGSLEVVQEKEAVEDVEEVEKEEKTATSLAMDASTRSAVQETIREEEEEEVADEQWEDIEAEEEERLIVGDSEPADQSTETEEEEPLDAPDLKEMEETAEEAEIMDAPEETEHIDTAEKEEEHSTEADPSIEIAEVEPVEQEIEIEDEATDEKVEEETSNAIEDMATMVIMEDILDAPEGVEEDIEIEEQAMEENVEAAEPKIPSITMDDTTNQDDVEEVYEEQETSTHEEEENVAAPTMDDPVEENADNNQQVEQEIAPEEEITTTTTEDANGKTEATKEVVTTISEHVDAPLNDKSDEHTASLTSCDVTTESMGEVLDALKAVDQELEEGEKQDETAALILDVINMHPELGRSVEVESGPAFGVSLRRLKSTRDFAATASPELDTTTKKDIQVTVRALIDFFERGVIRAKERASSTKDSNFEVKHKEAPVSKRSSFTYLHKGILVQVEQARARRGSL